MKPKLEMLVKFPLINRAEIRYFLVDSPVNDFRVLYALLAITSLL